ncbi:TrkH family potassium uptake protein, partial [Bordetella pertussis]
MKRLLATFYVLGLTMVVFALTMVIPLAVAYIGQDAGFTAFLEGFLLALG